MNRHYYRQYAELERTHWWFTVREKILRDQLKRYLPKGKPLQILNVGCATGRSSEWLSEFGEVTSLEYDEECCQYCRSELGLKVIQGSVTELPFEAETFDLVCAFDVIEHVENDRKGVAEIKRVTTTDGIILITVPALMTMWSDHDVVNKHFRRYTRKNFLRRFQSSNLATVRATYFNSLLLPAIAAFRVAGKIFLSKKQDAQVRNSNFRYGEQLLLQKLFRTIFCQEIIWLRNFDFMLGLSLMIIYQKDYALEKS